MPSEFPTLDTEFPTLDTNGAAPYPQKGPQCQMPVWIPEVVFIKRSEKTLPCLIQTGESSSERLKNDI